MRQQIIRAVLHNGGRHSRRGSDAVASTTRDAARHASRSSSSYFSCCSRTCDRSCCQVHSLSFTSVAVQERRCLRFSAIVANQPYRCISERRWASSSSDPDSDDNTQGVRTTPLSGVSEEDLQLAAAAAAQSEDSFSGSPPTDTQQQLNYDHLSDIPGAQAGGGKKLAIVFTCTVCNTRSAKKFSEQAYNHGVVLVRCPGCQSLHLIADRLGFFTDDEVDGNGDGTGWDVQKALEKRGDNIVAVTDDNVLELTVADVLGGDKMAEVTGTRQQQEQDDGSKDTSTK